MGGTVNAITTMCKTEGPLSLYKGFAATFARQCPYVVITWISVEQLKVLMKHWCHRMECLLTSLSTNSRLSSGFRVESLIRMVCNMCVCVCLQFNEQRSCAMSFRSAGFNFMSFIFFPCGFG